MKKTRKLRSRLVGKGKRILGGLDVKPTSIKNPIETRGGNTHKLWCQFPINQVEQATLDKYMVEKGVASYGALARALVAREIGFKV